MRIRVPATSANLGPGFDTLGLAMEWYNFFEAHPAESLSVGISGNSTVETAGLSEDIEENLLSKAYQAYFHHRQCPVIPAKLSIEAHIPLSRGLGSSSSAIVGGLFLADQMHASPLGKDALRPWAVDMEGHPDNVVPALLGNVHCCLDANDSIVFSWPSAWGIILVVPPTPLSTAEARAVMPQTHDTGAVVQTLRGIAAWVDALAHHNPKRFQYALCRDAIHEPARGPLIPEFAILKTLLKETDVMGVVISGAGSSLAVYTSHSKTQDTVYAMLNAAPELASCQIRRLVCDTHGVRLEDT